MSKRPRKLDNRRRRSQMNALLRRFDGRCWWCKQEVRRAESGAPTNSDPDIATRDHLRPYRLNQKWLAANLVLACRLCNHQRGSRTPDQWVQVLRSRGLDHNWCDLPPLEWGAPSHTRLGYDLTAIPAQSLWPTDDRHGTGSAVAVDSDIHYRCTALEQGSME